MHITVETHQMQDGTFRGYVVEGPVSALGWWSKGRSRQATYSAAVAGVRVQYPGLSLSFLHAES